MLEQEIKYDKTGNKAFSGRITYSQPRLTPICHMWGISPSLPQQQDKVNLGTRGWDGVFLGRSRDSPGCYSVWTGHSVVETSSVMVDEEKGAAPWPSPPPFRQP